MITTDGVYRTIPFKVGTYSQAQLLEFIKLPTEKQADLKKLAAERKKTAVPLGPYPYKDRECGWSLAWFHDNDTVMRWTAAAGVFLDVGFYSTTGQREGFRVVITCRQEVWDLEEQKLVLTDEPWKRTLSPPVAQGIIRNEHKNWGPYNQGMSKYVSEKQAITAMATLGRGRRIKSPTKPQDQVDRAKKVENPTHLPRDLLAFRSGGVGPITAQDQLDKTVAAKKSHDMCGADDVPVPAEKKKRVHKRVVKRALDFHKNTPENDKKRQKKLNKAAKKAANIHRDEMKLLELQLEQKTQQLNQCKIKIREASGKEFQLNNSWLQVAKCADKVIQLISCSVTDPKHLRSMIVRLACHAGNPQSVIQLATKFRSLAIENQRALFIEENARFSKLVEEKVALQVALDNLQTGRTVKVALRLPKTKTKKKAVGTAVGTVGTKAVGTTGTTAVGTVGTKSVDTVGTKAVGTSVGTMERHANWPADFTPKPHYIRSRRSKTGFKGVSIDSKNRGSAYRVKSRNNTLLRTNDLHEACQCFAAYREEVEAEEKEKKDKANSSVLDDLSFTDKIGNS